MEIMLIYKVATDVIARLWRTQFIIETHVFEELEREP